MEGEINSNYINYNSINSITKMFVSQSISQVVEKVSVMLSSLNVKSNDVEELSHCLPLFQIILSEISNMVSITQQQQQLPDQHTPSDELVWDSTQDFVVYPDTLTSSFSLSVSDLSSVVSSDSSQSCSYSDVLEDVNVGDLFVQEDPFLSKMTKAIDIAAPNSVFNARKSERNRR